MEIDKILLDSLKFVLSNKLLFLKFMIPTIVLSSIPVIGIFFLLWGNLAFTRKFHQSINNKEESLFTCYKKTLYRVIPNIFLLLFIFIVTVIGLIFLIIPGVIIFFRLSLIPYYLATTNLKWRDTIRASWESTKWKSLNILAANLVFFLLDFYGTVVATGVFTLFAVIAMIVLGSYPLLVASAIPVSIVIYFFTYLSVIYRLRLLSDFQIREV